MIRGHAHTSSSFSGRPFMPPLGNCRSASHHPSVGTSITSNRSRIASAAVHTHTIKKKERATRSKKKKQVEKRGERERGVTNLVPRDSRRRRRDQSRRQSCGTRRGRTPSACDRVGRARRGGRAPRRRSRGSACPSRQRRRLRRRPRVVAGPE